MSSAMMACAPRSPGTAMRHDPAAASIVIMLRSLNMYDIAQAVHYLTEQGAPVFDSTVFIL